MMRNTLLLTCLATALPMLSQAPVQAPDPAKAQPAQGPQALSLPDFPSRKNPYVIKGTMTVTLVAPSYAAVGAAGPGVLLKDGMADPEGGGKGGKRSKGGNEPGSGLSSTRSYFIKVPPKAKLKVALECRRLRNFNVRFVNDTYGRTEDPGLFINKIHHRDDAAFYENKSEEVRIIHCVLTGVEPMEEEPFSLVFTDF